VLWCGGLALSVWCVLEPVMLPYYLWPAYALLFLVATLRGPRRAVAVLACGVFGQWWAQRFAEDWVWYLPIVASLVVMLVLSKPRRRAVEGRDRTAGGPSPQEHPSTDQPSPTEQWERT
jgi:hypothetical protein